jgi:YfiH family protein
MSVIANSEPVSELAPLGVRACTTTRAVGSFGMLSDEPVREVMRRWSALREELPVARFATASQVHGANVVLHDGAWTGWLRIDAADGHAAPRRGIAMAVSVADCVPVFLAHPGGAVGILHAGWRGVAAGIMTAGLRTLQSSGVTIRDVHVHLGPAICGRCYEVGPDVYERLLGERPDGHRPVDLRAILAREARDAGAGPVTVSRWCTRCHNDRFFSHRAGDEGRQLGVIMAGE